MARSAIGLQKVQAQLFQSLDQIQSLRVEIAAMNTEIDLLTTDRIAKYGQIAKPLGSQPPVVRRHAASGSIAVDGVCPAYRREVDEPEEVRRQAGFLFFFQSKGICVGDGQIHLIDFVFLSGVQWVYKAASSDAFI